MCQYELWVYTRCRSTTPPVPPLPPSFPQHLLNLPPDQASKVSGPGQAAALLQKTYPHTTYYRVTKCRLSPECVPPSFSYLAPPPPPSPRLMRKMLATAHLNVHSQPNPHSPEAASAHTERPSTTPAPSGDSQTTNEPQETSVTTPPAQHLQALVPIHVRHSYCHSCYEILKESIDGDGELCFPIGSDNWLNINGKAAGKCWIMDERAARGDVIVDLDYSTGIDWGVEFIDSPNTLIPSNTNITSTLPAAIQRSEPALAEHTLRQEAAARESRLQREAAARELARQRELQREREEREKIRQSSLNLSKELERRKARIVAENQRKRRWKGWEAWGAPYVVPSAQRVGKAGAS